MADRLDQLEARLERVEDALGRVERRLTALDATLALLPAVTRREEPTTTAPPGWPPVGAPLDAVGLLSLVGRTSIVVGGAYMLRALTDLGQLPAGAGVVMALAYALTWLAAADRAAAAGRTPSALVHGVTAVVLGLSILWEASTRFGFLGGDTTATALAAFSGLALSVAWRRRLPWLAAAASLGTIVATLALVSAIGQAVSFSMLLILIGVATLWLGYDRDWFWLRWPAAIVVDVFVLGLAARATAQPPLEPPPAVIVVQMLLLAAYLSSFALRTLWRGRTVIPFEIAQTAAALAVGLGGAIVVARASGTGEAALGLAATLLGLGGYAVAFAFVGRRQGLGINFYFYATLAMVLTLTGLAGLLPAAPLAVALGALAVATIWIGHRISRPALTVHAAAYGAVAALVSGLLATAGSALTGTPGHAWPALDVTGWMVLAALTVCLAIRRPAETGAVPSMAGIPRLVLALVALVSVGGAVVSITGPIAAGTPPDAGVLATVRTAVIAGAAVLVAWLSRYDATREMGWLLYPVLLAGGLKLLVEDLRLSRPATLFMALALYGVALVVAPRLARRAAGVPSGQDARGPTTVEPRTNLERERGHRDVSSGP